MRKVAGPLRLSLAQSRELEAFAQFGSDLDAATQRQPARGARMVEVLKQPQYEPVKVEEQIVALFAVTEGYLDPVDVRNVRQWERDLLVWMRSSRPQVLESIRTKQVLDDAIVAELKSALEAFAPMFKPE
jgi:F-type H+-transporting ATPase subunit alpha